MMAAVRNSHRTSDNKTVAQLRAMFFAQTLAEVAGFAPTGPAITHWGNIWWATHTGHTVPIPLNHKWAEYLTGRLPHSTLRAALIKDFPILQTVLDDPLWPLLQRLLQPQENTGSWISRDTVRPASSAANRVRLRCSSLK